MLFAFVLGFFATFLLSFIVGFVLWIPIHSGQYDRNESDEEKTATLLGALFLAELTGFGIFFFVWAITLAGAA